jgi:hypothetical protein
MYDGRFGDRDPEDVRQEGLDEWRTEWAHPAWCVGWPRDTDGAAAALWVLWFFEGEGALRSISLRFSLLESLHLILYQILYVPNLSPSADTSCVYCSRWS